MSTELSVRGEAGIANGFEMKPRTLDEAMKYCDLMAASDLVPNGYKGKPGNIMVAIQMGQELGMTPMRALRSIAVINGRASMWGDDMLAMVLASPVCEYVREGESTDKVGVCRVKRKGDAEEHASLFTLEDAKRAGLLGKQGPWQTATSRMLKLRARGFALRDKFADVLAGLVTAEEAYDLTAEQPAVSVVEHDIPAPSLKDKLKAKIESVDVPQLPEPQEMQEPARQPAYQPVSEQSATGTDHTSEQQGDAAAPCFVWRTGKHKGKLINDDSIDIGFLTWAANNASLPDHRQAALDEIDRRQKQDVMAYEGQE